MVNRILKRIRISWPGGSVVAALQHTPSSEALIACLPFKSVAQTWGEEVYFGLPISVDLEANARQVVEPGTVCIWVQGHSMALPFGPTPIAEGMECKMVTPVNLLGWLEGDARVLAKVRDGDPIEVHLINGARG